MNTIKKAYYYFFYKIYKMMLSTSYPFGNFFSEFRAGLVIVILELWLFFTIQNYYQIINNIDPQSSSSLSLYIIGIIIIIFNYIVLDYNNILEKYKEEFDNIPKRKNKLGSVVVWLILLFVTINFFVSVHFSQKKFSIRYTPEFIAKEKKEDSLRKAKQIEKLKKIYGEDQKK